MYISTYLNQNLYIVVAVTVEIKQNLVWLSFYGYGMFKLTFIPKLGN